MAQPPPNGPLVALRSAQHRAIKWFFFSTQSMTDITMRSMSVLVSTLLGLWSTSCISLSLSMVRKNSTSTCNPYPWYKYILLIPLPLSMIKSSSLNIISLPQSHCPVILQLCMCHYYCISWYRDLYALLPLEVTTRNSK